MKNRIVNVYPNAVFVRSSAGHIYVADFSERTKAARKVEMHEEIPDCPLKPSQKMDCFVLDNKNALPIGFHIFSEQQLVDDEGKDIEHCECCFFPAEEGLKPSVIWIGFLEIKDCKVKNIAQYKDKTKEQIISTVRLFRKKGILSSSDRIYGLISFPRRKKVAFDQTIFEDITEYKRLYKAEHIHFFATNQVIVNDKATLSVG